MSKSKIYAYDCNECGIVFNHPKENKCNNCNSHIIPITHEMVVKTILMEKAIKIRRQTIQMIILSVGAFGFTITKATYIIPKIIAILLLILGIFNMRNAYRQTKLIRQIKKDVRQN